MKVVGLCGGIGAGKSTVATLLAERGAVVIDVDALSDSEPPKAEQCVVCLENLAAGEEVRRLQCLHLFHTHCSDRWLQNNMVCPVCKHAV